MKIPRVVNAAGHIDGDLIAAAAENKKKAQTAPWLKWGSLAACFALLLLGAVSILPGMQIEKNIVPPLPPATTAPANEGGDNAFEKRYAYGIGEGRFSTYIEGKVIAEEKVGDKIGRVAVTAGWKNRAEEWLSTEDLQAEVYALEGISEDVAVALKFIDQGEAITTTHYYVILNPDADLTAVQNYVIASVTPTENADAEAVPGNSTTMTGNETVTGTTGGVSHAQIPE